MASAAAPGPLVAVGGPPGAEIWRVAEPGAALGPLGATVPAAQLLWAGASWGVAQADDGTEVPVKKMEADSPDTAAAFARLRTTLFASLLGEAPRLPGGAPLPP
eukprot:10122726-Lingulodinium_polyedra.AAC.1